MVQEGQYYSGSKKARISRSHGSCRWSQFLAFVEDSVEHTADWARSDLIVELGYIKRAEEDGVCQGLFDFILGLECCICFSGELIIVTCVDDCTDRITLPVHLGSDVLVFHLGVPLCFVFSRVSVVFLL